MTATGPATTAPGLGARTLTATIRAYHLARRGRPSPCRFEPSCSAYAHEAIETHGAFRGSFLALRRLGRCRPFGGHGWDPVPAPPPPKAA
jgi:putative membrane protein insertion efficiency factor